MALNNSRAYSWTFIVAQLPQFLQIAQLTQALYTPQRICHQSQCLADIGFMLCRH